MKDFYDVHSHIINLSHPDFFSFVKRVNIGEYLFILSIPIIGPLISAFFYASAKKKIINSLSFMDNDISFALSILEKKDILPFFNERLKLENEEYDRIVITPLVIDFGQKYSVSNENIWYNMSPHKAVKYQVIDLFQGISEFYKENKVDKKVLIFPFLGLNPVNYQLEDEYDENGNIKLIGIKSLLDKYFKNFSKENISERKRLLFENMGNFHDIESLGNYAFCGIKLYPPLGFDPWPDDEKEREKVLYIYDYCNKKSIPLTTHIGVGGFQTINENKCKIFSSPLRWREILKMFPDLKVNFAHLNNKTFFKEIIFTVVENKNVYTDLAYSCFSEKEYENLEKRIRKYGLNIYDKLMNKILFGTDFSISLIKVPSYLSLLKNFLNTRAFYGVKNLLVNKNPERFLFSI